MPIEIIAKTTPAICIALGVISYFAKETGLGIGLILLGAILYILMIFFG